MAMRKEIEQAEYEAVCNAAKRNKDKRIDKRLQVVIMRYQGFKNTEIGKKLDLHPAYVSKLFMDYKKNGLEEYLSNHYKGNHRVLSFEEEKAILSQFEEKANAGQMVTAQDIKRAFDKVRGKDTGRSYIYALLARHNWRKVMPRPKHPKKADDAAIEASKKLTGQ